MKFPNHLSNLLRLVLTFFILYLLFTRFNFIQEQDFVKLVSKQVLNPFPSQAGERFNFITIITILGLFFNHFYIFLSLISDLSNGSKETIRFHSQTEITFLWKVMKLVFSSYVKSFSALVFCLFAVYFLVFASLPLQALAFLLSWFLTDTCLLFFIIRYSTSSVWTLIGFSAMVILHSFLFPYLIFLILFSFIVFIFSARRENTHVSNKKRL